MMDYGWIEYIYILDKKNNWKYLKPPNRELKDVKKDLEKEYKSMKIKRPKDYYGFWSEKRLIEERKKQKKQKRHKSEGEM